MAQVAKAAGQEPPKFKDHTPYLNREMKDLLKLNKLASTMRTEIIPPQLNKTQGLHPIGFNGNKHECDDRAPPSN